MFSTADTITAIATPPGRGGIGVVRLSGPCAHEIALTLIGRPARPLQARLATFARVRAGGRSGEPMVDQVVCTFFPGPRSYTGEDVVEISAHGSPVVLEQIVGAAAACGARVARPGEFTFRAYLHGRMDLLQAEAVADLIEAVTPAQAQVAFEQLDGRLTGALQGVEQTLFDLVVKLEASLDFPEEEYRFLSPAELQAGLGEVRCRVASLRRGAVGGRLIREGAQVAILGRPNVGKSSVFNALVGVGRAIVGALPGTTRDLVTERSDVRGIPVTFVDTAGLRDSEDEVEVEGIARARRASEVADVRLVVLDRSRSLDDDDRQLLGHGFRRSVVVANKCDLPAAWGAGEVGGEFGVDIQEVSARTGGGLEELRAVVAAALGLEEDGERHPRLSNMRHLALLEEADTALARAEAATEAGASEEFVLQDLREAIMSFDQITGARQPSEVLEAIFARFCIGK